MWTRKEQEDIALKFADLLDAAHNDIANIEVFINNVWAPLKLKRLSSLAYMIINGSENIDDFRATK